MGAGCRVSVGAEAGMKLLILTLWYPMILSVLLSCLWLDFSCCALAWLLSQTMHFFSFDQALSFENEYATLCPQYACLSSHVNHTPLTPSAYLCTCIVCSGYWTLHQLCIILWQEDPRGSGHWWWVGCFQGVVKSSAHPWRGCLIRLQHCMHNALYQRKPRPVS